METVERSQNIYYFSIHQPSGNSLIWGIKTIPRSATDFQPFFNSRFVGQQFSTDKLLFQLKLQLDPRPRCSILSVVDKHKLFRVSVSTVSEQGPCYHWCQMSDSKLVLPTWVCQHSLLSQSKSQSCLSSHCPVQKVLDHSNQSLRFNHIGTWLTLKSLDHQTTNHQPINQCWMSSVNLGFWHNRVPL